MNAVVPSTQALSSEDDRLLEQELSLRSVRTQVAIVRSLVDEVELLMSRGVGPTDEARFLLGQIADELGSLATRLRYLHRTRGSSTVVAAPASGTRLVETSTTAA